VVPAGAVVVGYRRGPKGNRGARARGAGVRERDLRECVGLSSTASAWAFPPPRVPKIEDWRGRAVVPAPRADKSLNGSAPGLCTGFQSERPAWLLRAPARRVSVCFLRIPAPKLRVEHLAYARLAFDPASGGQFLSR
jgi:hypothetical protein